MLMTDFEYRIVDPLGRMTDGNSVTGEWYALHFFRVKELACQHCGLVSLAKGFGEHLVVLRMAYNLPMTLSSACRCAEHNTNERGHINSAHICDKPTVHVPESGCCGVDVSNPDEKLIKLAMRFNWSIGISYDENKIGFVHLDRVSDYSKLKDYQRLFFYDNTPEEGREFWTDFFHQIQRLNEQFSVL